MSTVSYKTEFEIQQLGIEALRKGVGVVGLIRFMQQFDKGHGDYTKDPNPGKKTIQSTHL